MKVINNLVFCERFFFFLNHYYLVLFYSRRNKVQMIEDNQRIFWTDGDRGKDTCHFTK